MMKKLIAILVVFALFTSTAFAADVFFGAWGRGDFVPVRFVMDGAADTNDIYAGTEVSWGGTPAFGFQFDLNGGEIGFSGKIKFSNWFVGQDDLAYTWWKPLDALQLTIGWARWEVLRGAGGPESFAGYAKAGAFGEENLFARFDTTSLGAILQITPFENLYVGAAIITGVGLDTDWSTTPPTTTYGTDIGDVFKYSQYALGYDIPGIGLARFGYFGDQSQKIQVAFALKAVEGVYVDFGFSFKTAEALQDGKGDNIQINLVGSVDIGDMIGIWFGIDGQFGKKDAGSLSFGLNPTFKLDFGTVGLGFYMNLSFVKDSKPSMGFDLYLAKDVGGGTFKAGVAVGITPQQNDKSFVVFQLPIEITYSIY
jgi:hypothetical protein